MHSKKTTLINIATKKKLDIIYEATMLFEDDNLEMKKIIELISSGWRVISINKGTGIFMEDNKEVFLGDKISFKEKDMVNTGIVKVKAGKYVVETDKGDRSLREVISNVMVL